MANGDALLPGLLPAGEQHEVLKTLGQGAYGVVALARDKETDEKARSDAHRILQPGAAAAPSCTATSQETEAGQLAVCNKIH